MTIEINGSGSVTGITTRLADAGAPAGSVIQVVQSTYTAVNNSGSIGDSVDWDLETVWSGTITPSQADSKILVSMMISVGNVSASPVPAYLKRKIGSGSAAAVQAPPSYGSRTPATIVIPVTHQHHGSAGFLTFLDSPNTTDACKYWVTLRHQTGSSNTIYLNQSSVDSDDGSYSRAISNMVLQEIAV
tara:strand:+ start:28 stop:591 length:564 start_codon:yes stop_codon:yes gene_type:complete